MLNDAVLPTSSLFHRARLFLESHPTFSIKAELEESRPLALMRGRQLLTGQRLRVTNCYMLDVTWRNLVADPAVAQSYEWLGNDFSVPRSCVGMIYGMYTWSVPREHGLAFSDRQVLFYSDSTGSLLGPDETFVEPRFALLTLS